MIMDKESTAVLLLASIILGSLLITIYSTNQRTIGMFTEVISEKPVACATSHSYVNLFETGRTIECTSRSCQEYTDYCEDDLIVHKFYCNGKELDYSVVPCPNGFACFKGSCNQI